MDFTQTKHFLIHWFLSPQKTSLSSKVNALVEVKLSFMDDGLGKIKIIQDHFNASTSNSNSPQTPLVSQPRIDHSLSSSNTRLSSCRKLRNASFMLRLFSLRGLPWSGGDGQEKIELSAAEVESLRSELALLEEKEAHLKAQLEHVDEILRSARLSGYLYIRTRWATLPGEPPPIDDSDVDDWLPRFVVLQGPCLFFYLLSTDLSPQDSTMLPDVVEVGSLPSFEREGEGTFHAFCILTRQGLRIECSSISKIQVDSWLEALRSDLKLVSDSDSKSFNGL